MLRFAVVKCKLKPWEFWSLSLFEWKLCIEQYESDLKDKSDDREFYLAVERIKIADFKNAHFRKPSGAPLGLEPQDIFHLSFDKKPTDERPLTFKEAKALFGSRIKKG